MQIPFTCTQGLMMLSLRKREIEGPASSKRTEKHWFHLVWVPTTITLNHSMEGTVWGDNSIGKVLSRQARETVLNPRTHIKRKKEASQESICNPCADLASLASLA